MNIHSNPVVLKVLDGGTPRSDVNLCPTCTRSHIFTNVTGDKRVRCMASYDKPLELREAIVSCSHYYDKSAPSLHDMEQIAWSLMTNKGGKSLGFKPPDRKDGDISPPIGF